MTHSQETSTTRYFHAQRLALGVSCVLVFLLALGLRLTYQSVSEVDNPYRADAGKYATAAFNQYFHGVHSLDAPSKRRTPTTRTDLAPGYPLFLTAFFSENPNDLEIYRRVGVTQAVMGASTAVLTLLLACTVLPLAWALLAGIFTALSPHLITMDQLLLTESLFTVLVSAGLLVVSVALRRESLFLVFLGTMLLAVSGQVRTLGMILAPLVALAFLLSGVFPMICTSSQAWANRLKLAGVPLLAMVLIYLAHQVFLVSAVVNAPGVEKPSEEYVQMRSPWTYFGNSVRPPQFLVEGTSHVLVDNQDPGWKASTTVPFAEAPTVYLHWNTWGRWFWMWHFDSAYGGEVYAYPMLRKGFQENTSLNAVHGLMRALHWPLYFLSWMGLISVGLSATGLRYFQSEGYRKNQSKPLTIVSVCFFGFLLALSFVAWLPRYTIPMRPMSYVLAAAALFWLQQWLVHFRTASTANKAG